MSRFIIDAYAWIEYFDGTTKGLTVKKILESDKHECFTGTVTIAEVISKMKRLKKNHVEAFNAMIGLSKILSLSESAALKAGEKHAEMRLTHKDFGMADAFVWAHAKENGLQIMTGDPHFKSFKNSFFI